VSTFSLRRSVISYRSVMLHVALHTLLGGACGHRAAARNLLTVAPSKRIPYGDG
jgi:hypothetical protein